MVVSPISAAYKAPVWMVGMQVLAMQYCGHMNVSALLPTAVNHRHLFAHVSENGES